MQSTVLEQRWTYHTVNFSEHENAMKCRVHLYQSFADPATEPVFDVRLFNTFILPICGELEVRRHEMSTFYLPQSENKKCHGETTREYGA
jgi:hypothetical protein